jgi:hypothetical protein
MRLRPKDVNGGEGSGPAVGSERRCRSPPSGCAKQLAGLLREPRRLRPRQELEREVIQIRVSRLRRTRDPPRRD